MTNNNTSIITQSIGLKPLRVKFSDDMMEQLSIFSKIHQYDDRHSFNKYWADWIIMPDISELISGETLRINNLGFSGDIPDKMYKSARYYFRKKPLVQSLPVDRKEYEVVPKIVLETMDKHVKLQIASKLMVNLKDQIIKVSPADSFNKFCDTHQDIILIQINYEYGQTENIVSSDQVCKVMYKMKKIYKNRFYNIRVKIL
jgi:hypothetical protein